MVQRTVISGDATFDGARSSEPTSGAMSTHRIETDSVTRVPVKPDSAKPSNTSGEEPPKGKILVVDDTEASYLALSEMLESRQFQVTIAVDGRSAIALAQSTLPDLVLLDIKLPDIDGFETCRALKSDALTGDIPVIFISGIQEVFDKVRGFQTGAVDYITKPFQIEEVIARVDTHLRLQRLRDRLVTKNHVLTEALAQLKETQRQLIESEKMATLGNLVAGIAHEINTPVGVGVTAASTLQDETRALDERYQNGQVSRMMLEEYLQTARHSSQLILNNLQRAADLIQNLKKISADQIYLERRHFALHWYIQEILSSLEPLLKHTKHTIVVDSYEPIDLQSYPGALSQILTNLVMNSIKHAYPTGKAGTLRIAWYQQQQRLLLLYSDDGCGIVKDDLPYIFEPFFTTARKQGGTGLGLHIVKNLVTQKLGGQIHCTSEIGQGTKFTIDLPLCAPSAIPEHVVLPELNVDPYELESVVV